jgi:CHAT domain-containing protein
MQNNDKYRGRATRAAIAIIGILGTGISWSEASHDEFSAANIQAAYESGDYLTVVESLDAARTGQTPVVRDSADIRWLLMHADAYSRLGLESRAADLLLSSRYEVAEDDQAGIENALYFGHIGNARLFRGQLERAAYSYRRGLESAASAENPALRGRILNDLGRLHVRRRDPLAAIATFNESVAEAARAGDDALAATAGTNLARAMVSARQVADLRSTLDAARIAVSRTPRSADRVIQQLSIGRLYSSAQEILGPSGELRSAAHEQLTEALRLASDLGDDRSTSFALGYLGGLYEYEGRDAEASILTKQAIDLAAQSGADEALFQWEWQMARLQARAGRDADALDSYRRAVQSVARIRDALTAAQPDAYETSIRPLYRELTDLLLRTTASLGDDELIQANLAEARVTWESLKTAEIVDYFDNDCVIQEQDRAAAEQLSDTAAVIYPVLMDDRLEILVSVGSSMYQVQVSVATEELTREIRRFRLGVEDATSRDRFMPSSRQLYDWLVRPLEAILAAERIDTLVFVPDGPLRTIPMSALYDGRRYVVERYALATTPGISLNSADATESGETRVLANGLTESVQGFAALPNVAEELAGIQRLYPTRINRDANFQLRTIERSLTEGRYSIVHIATHGQFDGDYRNSFLLTHDDRMNMTSLEEALSLRRYREEAIDLLVLSACQTAAGDDRAALGMAGIALKAGVRSALASLWFIDDASTSALMQDFYSNLKDEDMTKAEALRLAQVGMIQSSSRNHPAHWAPFLLIGDWL